MNLSAPRNNTSACDILCCLKEKLITRDTRWGLLKNVAGFDHWPDFVSLTNELSPEEIAAAIIAYAIKRVSLFYICTSRTNLRSINMNS